MSKLNEEMKRAAKRAGGAEKTKADRKKHVCRFGDFLRMLGINIEKSEQIKMTHIEQYVANRLAGGIGKRTIQNEMSGIRKVLTESGRNEFAENPRISNESLGLSGASRKGSKLPILGELYQTVLNEAMQYDAGFAAAMMLSRHLGLRAEEVVQSYKSVPTWEKRLKTGDRKLRVIFGTKGGRSRDVTIHNRKEVIKAVDFAASVLKARNGKLINKDNLKEAMMYFQNTARKLGLVGKYAYHSLRYAYSIDATNNYLSQSYSLREALAQTSQDLGHGDGRGRWIKSVYNLSLNLVHEK